MRSSEKCLSPFFSPRERVNGKYHRLNDSDWIISYDIIESIAIIDSDTWNRPQDKIKMRSDKNIKKLENKDVTVIRRNDGMLPLLMCYIVATVVVKW